MSPFTYWGINKMDNNWQTIFSNECFWGKTFVYCINLNFTYVCLGWFIGNNSATVKVMAWRQTGGKQRHEPTITKFYDAICIPMKQNKLVLWSNEFSRDVSSKWVSRIARNPVLGITLANNGPRTNTITMTSWWPQWRLKSPASRMFTQPFIQMQIIKESIKAPRHWPLCEEFTGDRWIPRTKGQFRGKCFHLMTSSCRQCTLRRPQPFHRDWEHFPS